MRFRQNHDQKNQHRCVLSSLLRKINSAKTQIYVSLCAPSIRMLWLLHSGGTEVNTINLSSVCGLIVVVLANLLYAPSAAHLSRLRGRITINCIVVHLHHYLTKLTQYARSGTGG